ncbi:MAG: 2-C-methyl-D-erythritol 2,4-cyclodiphosphate synthase, partial [bacterium]|nr:2-C-methyl-D-erythritol 2,4-cyclodiphosphate synthase [bacterium]
QNNEKGSNIVKSAAGLKKTIQILDEKNFEIINIDAVIIGVISKNHHRTNEIKTGIRSILGMTAEDINVKNVKAQTREAKKIAGIEGRAGRGEPMECYCVSMIRSLA